MADLKDMVVTCWSREEAALDRINVKHHKRIEAQRDRINAFYTVGDLAAVDRIYHSAFTEWESDIKTLYAEIEKQKDFECRKHKAFCEAATKRVVRRGWAYRMACEEDNTALKRLGVEIRDFK